MSAACGHLGRADGAIIPRHADPLPGWTLVGQVQRPTDRDEVFGVFRRAAP